MGFFSSIAKIGKSILGGIGSAIGGLFGFSKPQQHGLPPNAYGGAQLPGGGYGGIGNMIGGFNSGPGPGSGNFIYDSFGRVIGSALGGFGNAVGGAAGNVVGQYAQGKFSALAGIDAQGGKNARSFMQNLYGPDVKPWDWLSGNSNNQGSVQAPQIQQDKNRLRTEERIADKNFATQKYVSDNSVKASQYAAETAAGASRYGSDKTYEGIERVQEDPFRTNLLMAQAAESRIRTRFDEAQIEVAKQDAILREYQISYTKSMTNLNSANTSSTYENLDMAWKRLPTDMQWIKQQTLTSEQQRIMLEVGNIFQAGRTVLPKINLFGWQPFANGDDGTQALADLWTFTFTAGAGAGPLMRLGKGAVSGAKTASVGAKAFMQAYQLARKQGHSHIRALKAGYDYVVGKPVVAR